MLASAGYVAVVDAGLCAACGTCADVCQFAATSTDDGPADIDAAPCMGCGMCVTHYPQVAISLQRNPAMAIPVEIRELVNRAAN